MSLFKVVILPHGFPSTDSEQQIIRQAGGWVVDGDQLPSEAAALREAEDAEAILVRWTPLTPEHIRRFRCCRIIVRYGIGYDNVDYEAATAAGILIGHCTDYCVDEVATHALALLLACVRDVAATHQRVAAGGWNVTPPVRQRRLAGSTLGLVGLGNIGRAVARKLGGWNLRLLALDPYVPPEQAAELGVELVDLPTLCHESDYVSMHAPLLPETRHLIGRRELASMKPGVMLINTARGPLVDEAALAESLASGHVAAAGLDVFETEPLAPGSPLREHPRVIVSDHAAWYSEDSLKELKKSVGEEAVRACTGGLPIAIANPEVLHKLGRFHEWRPNYNAQWRARRAALASQCGVPPCPSP
ncbi:MAG: C-terminal binding protein [Verrucomicrobiota bacterium]|jgi:D-3-phosphoglycerate dehydrogenase